MSRVFVLCTVGAMSQLLYTGSANANSLAAHWKFDADGSDALGKHNGNLSGDAFTSSGGSGIAGECLVLDGDGDYWILDEPTADFNLSTFSVSLWFRGSLNQRYIYSLLDLHHGCCHGPAPHGWTFQGEMSANNLRFVGYRPGGWFAVVRYDANSLLNDGWHHLVASYAGFNELSLYVDGQLIDTLALVGVPPPTYDGAAALTIGRLGSAAEEGLPPNDRDFLGRIDDVQIYNHALGASEVSYLYNNPGTTLAAIPTVSGWAMVAMAALMLAAGAVVVSRRRAAG